MMLFAMARKSSIKRVLKFAFSGFSVFFIGMLIFLLIHDTLTGQSSTTEEYCAKY